MINLFISKMFKTKLNSKTLKRLKFPLNKVVIVDNNFNFKLLNDLANILGISVSTEIAILALSCSQFSRFTQPAMVEVGIESIVAMSRCDLPPLTYRSLAACFVCSLYFMIAKFDNCRVKV